MRSKLVLYVVFAATVAVASSDDTCLGQTRIQDIQTLFPYCEGIINSNSQLEDEVKNFDVEDSLEELCKNIRKMLSHGNNSLKTMSKFNKCMALKSSGLGFYQVKKVSDCLATLKDPELMNDVTEVMYDHVVDRKIYRATMEYLNDKRTESNKYAMDKFFDCIGYHPDTWFQHHNYS